VAPAGADGRAPVARAHVPRAVAIAASLTVWSACFLPRRATDDTWSGAATPGSPGVAARPAVERVLRRPAGRGADGTIGPLGR